jgi:hypothetical protein
MPPATQPKNMGPYLYVCHHHHHHHHVQKGVLGVLPVP